MKWFAFMQTMATFQNRDFAYNTCIAHELSMTVMSSLMTDTRSAAEEGHSLALIGMATSNVAFTFAKFSGATPRKGKKVYDERHGDGRTSMVWLEAFRDSSNYKNAADPLQAIVPE
jgi:hypothetical protein